MKGKKMETWAKTLKRFGHWAKGWRDWAIGRFVTKKLGQIYECFMSGHTASNSEGKARTKLTHRPGASAWKMEMEWEREWESRLWRESTRREWEYEKVCACVVRERERERERQHVIKTVTLLRIRGCIQMEIREFQQINQPSFRFKTSNKVLIV